MSICVTASEVTAMKKDEFISHVQQLTNLSKEHAEDGTKIVLEILSRRLTLGESKDVSSQLPKGIKEMWDGDGFLTQVLAIPPSGLDYKTAFELYHLVQQKIDKQGLPIGAERLVTAVFHVLKEQIDAGEQKDIMAQLPTEIKQILAEA